jgi:ADP-ribose pyrophosphatase YjhB (NUDIX family)
MQQMPDRVRYHPYQRWRLSGLEETVALDEELSQPSIHDDSVQPLFRVEMQWGQQPVRLTAWRCASLPEDAPTTSVHIVGFHGDRVLVVRDRKGIYGFPGGRLEPGETLGEALSREVYEEACAHLESSYTLFAIIKIECTAQIPGRAYPHPYSYMAMYAGVVRALEPIRSDPAGIITARDLFTRVECEQKLDSHDRLLLQEAVSALKAYPTSIRQRRALSRFGDLDNLNV